MGSDGEGCERIGDTVPILLLKRLEIVDCGTSDEDRCAIIDGITQGEVGTI